MRFFVGILPLKTDFFSVSKKCQTVSESKLSEVDF